MRTLVILCALLCAFAQALTLDEALQAAPKRTSVVTARAELRNAVVSLERVQGDPLAVRADKLQAEQRLALAQSSFTQAYYAALGEIEGAYTNVLQARMAVQVSQKGASVSEKASEIAQIRVDNGSGTQLDLEESRTSQNESRNGLRSAQDNLNVALSNLESILNQEFTADDLEDVPNDYLVQIPELEQVLEVAAGYPTILQAEQQLASAQLGSDVLDPSYASQTQRDSASTGLANAQEGLQETRRGFRIQARNLFNSTVSAQEAYRTQQEALRNTNARLQTQRQRFQGGLISQIELSQAELSTMQAELSAQQARYRYLTSLLELQSGTLVDLEGPATLDAPPIAQVIEGARVGGSASSSPAASGTTSSDDGTSSAAGSTGSTSTSGSDAGGATGGSSGSFASPTTPEESPGTQTPQDDSSTDDTQTGQDGTTNGTPDNTSGSTTNDTTEDGTTNDSTEDSTTSDSTEDNTNTPGDTTEDAPEDTSPTEDDSDQ